MSIATLTPRVREALGVSDSYDAAIIPAAIKRAAGRLLRDYNFPKARLRTSFAGPHATNVPQPAYAIPTGMGEVLMLRWADGSGNWSDPLIRRDEFVLPSANPDVGYWWQDGTNLRLSNTIDPAMVNWTLYLWYRTISPDVATWIYDDFEDVLYYATVYREAATMRKPEVQQAFQALYTEELQALAIFLNELEWNGVVVKQRETNDRHLARYPIS